MLRYDALKGLLGGLIVKIEPKWNVKNNKNYLMVEGVLVEIEPKWNVKVVGDGVNYQIDFGRNRTKVEC